MHLVFKFVAGWVLFCAVCWSGTIISTHPRAYRDQLANLILHKNANSGAGTTQWTTFVADIDDYLSTYPTSSHSPRAFQMALWYAADTTQTARGDRAIKLAWASYGNFETSARPTTCTKAAQTQCTTQAPMDLVSGDTVYVVGFTGDFSIVNGAHVIVSYPGCAISGITSGGSQNKTKTVTCTDNHNLATNDLVKVWNTGVNSLNEQNVTVASTPTASIFTFVGSSGATTASTGRVTSNRVVLDVNTSGLAGSFTTGTGAIITRSLGEGAVNGNTIRNQWHDMAAIYTLANDRLSGYELTAYNALLDLAIAAFEELYQEGLAEPTEAAAMGGNLRSGHAASQALLTCVRGNQTKFDVNRTKIADQTIESLTGTYGWRGGASQEGPEYGPQAAGYIMRQFEDIKSCTNEDMLTTSAPNWPAQFIDFNLAGISVTTGSKGVYFPPQYRDELSDITYKFPDTYQLPAMQMLRYLYDTGDTTRAAYTNYWFNQIIGTTLHPSNAANIVMYLPVGYTTETDWRTGTGYNNYHAEGMGISITKSSHAVDATSIHFFALPRLFQHNHMDACSLDVYRGSTLLVGHNPGYGTFAGTDAGRANWKLGNTPLVYGPYQSRKSASGSWESQPSIIRYRDNGFMTYSWGRCAGIYRDLSTQNPPWIIPEVNTADRRIATIRSGGISFIFDKLEHTVSGHPIWKWPGVVLPTTSGSRIEYANGSHKAWINVVEPTSPNFAIRDITKWQVLQIVKTGQSYVANPAHSGTRTYTVPAGQTLVILDVNHSFATGNSVTFSGATGNCTALNATFTVTVPSGNSTLPFQQYAILIALDTTASSCSMVGQNVRTDNSFNGTLTQYAVTAWDGSAAATVYGLAVIETGTSAASPSTVTALTGMTNAKGALINDIAGVFRTGTSETATVVIGGLTGTPTIVLDGNTPNAQYAKACAGDSCTISYPGTDLTADAIGNLIFTEAGSTPPPIITASPASFSFASQEATNPATQNLFISNSGVGTCNWTASDDQAWLSLSPTTGTDFGTVVLTVTAGALTPNIYTATITLSCTGAINVTRQVSYTVTAAPIPVLAATPTTLNFSTTTGVNPAAQSFSISGGAVALNGWTAAVLGCSFASLNASSGTGNASIQVSINVSGVAAGVSQCTARVTSATASPTTVDVVITLTITGAGAVTALTKESLSFGASRLSDTVTVTNSGDAVVGWTWTATVISGSVAVSPSTGGTGDVLTVTAVPLVSESGERKTATIEITAPGTTAKRIDVDYLFSQYCCN